MAAQQRINKFNLNDTPKWNSLQCDADDSDDFAPSDDAYRADELSLSTDHLASRSCTLSGGNKMYNNSRGPSELPNLTYENRYPKSEISRPLPVSSDSIGKPIIPSEYLIRPRVRRKTANFKCAGKAIVSKLLNVTHGSPSRITFAPPRSKDADHSIINGDFITIFMRYYWNHEAPLKSPLPLNDSVCDCVADHRDAVFCVKDWRKSVSWESDDGCNPKAKIFVSDVSSLEIEFASLVLHSTLAKDGYRQRKVNLQELVFQVERDRYVLEQTYYMKCSASPGRDIKSFEKDLHSWDLIQQIQENPKRDFRQVQKFSTNVSTKKSYSILIVRNLTGIQKNVIEREFGATFFQWRAGKP